MKHLHSFNLESWPSLSSKGQVQTVANHERKGCTDNRAVLGQGLGSPSMDTHYLSLSFSVERNPPQNGRAYVFIFISLCSLECPTRKGHHKLSETW